jgi:hypothetical protein
MRFALQAAPLRPLTLVGSWIAASAARQWPDLAREGAILRTATRAPAKRRAVMVIGRDHQGPARRVRFCGSATPGRRDFIMESDGAPVSSVCTRWSRLTALSGGRFAELNLMVRAGQAITGVTIGVSQTP